jgi:hypothetical protein
MTLMMSRRLWNMPPVPQLRHAWFIAGAIEEIMMGGGDFNDLESRLVAHRRVLQWLLGHMEMNPSLLKDLEREMGEPYPPLDHQEDPGAVPTEQFGNLVAYAAEVRLLLEKALRRDTRSRED